VDWKPIANKNGRKFAISIKNSPLSVFSLYLQKLDKYVMKLIGRKIEIKRLNNYYNSGKSEFIALYGRRRVGKTYLVESLYGNEFAFNVTGIIEGTRKEEEEVFLNALRRTGYDGKPFETWLGAFTILKEQLQKTLDKKGRCIVFIDELPCFDTLRAGFVKAFGDFWNDWCVKHPEVMLVVCGSATTWMIKNIIDSRGGLHNRITHEMHIHPFALLETEEYLRSNDIDWDRLSIVQLYSILGGIPYYLSLIQPDDSVASAVDRLFYAEDAELKGEYDRLFKSLYNSPEPYLKIIEVLCKSRDGLTRDEIASKMAGRDNGHLSDYLDNLEKCDFIRVYFVKDSLGKTLKKTGGIYQIMDLFTMFHNSFLTSPSTDPHYWSNHLDTPTLNTWFGLAFERICAYHIEQIKHALKIDAIGTEYFSWRSKANPPKAQIDLIIERADRKTNICEVKYSESDYSLQKEEDAKIRNRISTYREESRTRYSLLPILVTTYGLRQGKYSSLFKSVITMDQLFVLTE